jgi:hypothetical protein
MKYPFYIEPAPKPQDYAKMSQRDWDKRYARLEKAIDVVRKEADVGLELEVDEVVTLCIAAGTEALFFSLYRCVVVAYNEEIKEGKRPNPDYYAEHCAFCLLALLLQLDREPRSFLERSASQIECMIRDLIMWHCHLHEQAKDDAAYVRLCYYVAKGLRDAILFGPPVIGEWEEESDELDVQPAVDGHEN